MDIVYFELNDWTPGKDYPDVEPFDTWINDWDFVSDQSDDYIPNPLRKDEWIKENKLIVVFSLYDHSMNYCITAPKEWVEKNCPELLTKYTQFLRYPKDGEILPRPHHWGYFLEYKEENIGLHKDMSYWCKDK